MVISLRTGHTWDRDALCRRLVELQYERNDLNFDRNRFRVRGDTLEIRLAYTDDYAIRVEFFGDEIDRISEIHPVTGAPMRLLDHVAIYPASHYVTPKDKLEEALGDIEAEMEERVKYFEENGSAYIACGENTAIEIKIICPDGSKKMDSKAFINGRFIPSGATIEG
jgi:excinuclease ABC subunit B